MNTSVRFPSQLHEQLVREAARQDRSVSSLVVHYARRGNLRAKLDSYIAARLASGVSEATADLDRRKVEYFLAWLDDGTLPGGES